MYQMVSEHFSSIERLMFVVDKIACCIQRYQGFEKCFSHIKACSSDRCSVVEAGKTLRKGDGMSLEPLSLSPWLIRSGLW